jgi:hypothetical protein
VDSESDLPHVVFANRASGCCSYHLNGRKQHPDQNANNGNHDQQLNKREPGTTRNFVHRLFQYRFKL